MEISLVYLFAGVYDACALYALGSLGGYCRSENNSNSGVNVPLHGAYGPDSSHGRGVRLAGLRNAQIAKSTIAYSHITAARNFMGGLA